MNNFLFEYTSKNKNASKRLKPHFKALFILLMVAISIFSFLQISFKLNLIGYEDVAHRISKLFEFNNFDSNFPSYTVLENSLNYLWITIKVTLVGTTIGFLVSIATAFLSSKNITNSFLSFLFKLFILFLRSFPTIVFISASKDAFNMEFAAIVIFAWFSWIWCNKYLVEIIANLDTKGYYWYINKGYGKIYSFKKQVLGRCKNKFVMVYLYSLESNFRWTTLLATVGVIGIGFFIDLNIPQKLEFVGIPLAIILAFILFLELFSVFINKVLLNVKSKTKKTFQWREWIKYFLILFIISITIYVFSTINLQKMNFQIFKEKLRTLSNPEISFWSKNQTRLNPWLGILELFYQCIVAISFALVYSIIMSVFLSEKIQKSFIWIPAKIINNILKVLPIVILFHIFNPLFMSSIGLGVILFGIHSGTVIAKQLSESINNLETEIIEYYKLKGFSKIFIIKTYVWPTIKRDFKSFAYIRLEMIFRSMIILGSLGFSIIGNNLDKFEHRKQLHYAASYIWPILITIFIYNLLPSLINVIKRRIIWRKS